MAERFLTIISMVSETLGGGWLLIGSLSLILLIFIIVLIQAIAVRDYSFAKRGWFVLFCGATCLAQAVFTPKGEKVFVIFTLSISLLLCSCLFSVRVRRKVDKEHKKLIDFIDGQIRRSGSQPRVSVHPTKSDIDILDQPLVKDCQEDRKAQTTTNLVHNDKQHKELDFTHVKSVISKLSYYGLSQSDKRQVQDLETALYQAEQGEDVPGLKSRINDGLGALLKIMSKYGI